MTADDQRALDEQLDRLNRDFYSADPAEYFEVRWLSLLLLAGRPDDIMAMLADGATYEHVHATITGGVASPEGVRNFATVESQVLFHHASEALLRLYLAHVVQPPCPWLEVASERLPGFKDHLRSKVLVQLSTMSTARRFTASTHTPPGGISRSSTSGSRRTTPAPCHRSRPGWSSSQ